MKQHFYEMRLEDGTIDCFMCVSGLKPGPHWCGMTVLREVTEQEYVDSQLKKLVDRASVINKSRKKES